MPISHKHQIIFVHIPKTAGTSVEYALGMHGKTRDVGIRRQRRQRANYHYFFGKGLQHLTLSDLEQMFRSMYFNDYSRLGSAKHLIDRVFRVLNITRHGDVNTGYSTKFSEYYKFAVVRNPYDRLLSHYAWLTGIWDGKTPPNKDDFSTYVSKVHRKQLHKNAKVHGGHLRPQNEFVMLGNVVGVDKLLRFENLGNEFNKMCGELCISVELPKRMVSVHQNYEKYYDKESKYKVYEIYHKDFELFGYEP